MVRSSQCIHYGLERRGGAPCHTLSIPLQPQHREDCCREGRSKYIAGQRGWRATCARHTEPQPGQARRLILVGPLKETP